VKDKLILSGMTFFSAVGIYEEERRLSQKIVVDMELYLDLEKAGKSDQLTDTINYEEVYNLVRSICEDKSFFLIEALGEEIAKEVLNYFPVISINLRVKKYQPPLKGLVDFVGIEIQRSK
jgi:dihydroneopterin aldolase